MRKAAIRAGLETLYFSGIHHLARPLLAGEGAILMFHRVRPAGEAGTFQPNRHLEITPGYLDELIGRLRDAGVDIIPMDEVPYRLMTRGHKRRFVALTFDDGYRDNMVHAWPVLKRHQAPFAIYVATAFADGMGQLWWMAVEKAIAKTTASRSRSTAASIVVLDCSTLEAKYDAFRTVMRWIDETSERGGDPSPRRRTSPSATASIWRSSAARRAWTGTSLRAMAADPLATIGAHTVNHVAAFQDARGSRDAARWSMAHAASARCSASRRAISPIRSAAPSRPAPREFDLAAKAGFATAVTTRPGVLHASHARAMTALPRISINGEFQRLRYLDVLLSGAPTALMNALRGSNAA